jgi:hypothetical protein
MSGRDPTAATNGNEIVQVHVYLKLGSTGG